MRPDLLRWGGISSLILAAVFAVHLVLGFAMGVDIYSDGEPEELLTDIKDNEAAFVAWNVLGMAVPLLFVPTALGFIYAAREEDRPYLGFAAAFFAIAAVLAVIGYGFGPLLFDIADKYATASAGTREALLHDGENAQSMMLVIGGASYIPFAIGMITMGVLSLRSRFAPGWVAWPAIAIGIMGLVPFVGFVAVVPGRILWLLICGVIMLRKTGAASAPNVQRTRASGAMA